MYNKDENETKGVSRLKRIIVLAIVAVVLILSLFFRINSRDFKTNNVEDYLLIDKSSLYAVQEEKLFSVFPKVIPDNAADAEYEYSYLFDMHILAKWSLLQEEFYAEKKRIATLLANVTNPHYDLKEYSFEVTGPNKLCVEFDELNYCVKYEFFQVDFANQ